MKGRSFSLAVRVAFIGVVVLMVATGKLWAQTAGALDTSFGTNGKATTSFLSQARGNAMVVQPDGRIVVAGTGGADDFALVRYNSDGSLDTGFNSTGLVTTDMSGRGDEALAVALQSDGKIIAAGYATAANGQRWTAMARYNTDGTLDATFGSGGKVVQEIPSSPFEPESQIFSVIVLSDGKILAGGGIHFPTPEGTTLPERNRVFLTRYDSNGALDPTFGSVPGIASEEVGHFEIRQNVSALAVQADGTIVASVVAGISGAVARYSALGAPDSSFGTAGHVLNVGDHALAVAVQTDGKILVAGDENENFLITRLNSDGTTDSTFGSSGEVQTDFGGADVATAVVLLSDGHFVAGGYSTNAPLGGSRDFAIARYNSDGSLNLMFGNDGAVLTDFNSTNDIGTAIAIQSDGKLLAAGSILDVANSVFSFGVARYLMKEPTTTSLFSSLNPSTFGQSVTFTANVSSAGGTPTGTVEFRDSGVLIGAGTLSGGVATFSTSLGAGAHQMTAVYTGTPIFLGSTSEVGTQTVDQAATTTTLSSSPEPSNVGQVVTFTAAVTVVPPGTANVTGTVDFFDGGIRLNSNPVRVRQGVAEFSTAGLAKGIHRIIAVYNGAHNLGASTSPELRQQVKP